MKSKPEWLNLEWRKTKEHEVDISWKFFGEPGRPRRITLSATCQGASCLLAKPGVIPYSEVSNTLCCYTASWETPAGLRLAAWAISVMQVSVRTWVEAHTTTQGCRAFVITLDKKTKKRSRVSGSFAFVFVIKRIKWYTQMHFLLQSRTIKRKQTSLHHICPQNCSLKETQRPLFCFKCRNKQTTGVWVNVWDGEEIPFQAIVSLWLWVWPKQNMTNVCASWASKQWRYVLMMTMQHSAQTQGHKVTHIAVVDVEDMNLCWRLNFLHSGSVPAAVKG